MCYKIVIGHIYDLDRAHYTRCICLCVLMNLPRQDEIPRTNKAYAKVADRVDT